jgi:branched-chain amino acid transport system substrate-binding protein
MYGKAYKYPKDILNGMSSSGVANSALVAVAVVVLLIGLVTGIIVSPAIMGRGPIQTVTKTETITVGAGATVTQTIATTVTQTSVSTVTITQQAGPWKTVYTIGFAYELTGPFGQLAIDVKDAGLLAVMEINDLLENIGSPIRFKAVVEDTGGTPEGAVRAVQTLVEVHGATIIVGPIGSAGVSAVKGYIDQKRIPLIACCSTSVGLKLDDYIFRVVASADILGKSIARLVISDGYKKVAAIYRGDAFGKSLFAEFKKSFESAGGDVVSEIAYDPATADFTPEISKLSASIKKYGMDTAVLTISFLSDGLLLLDKARLDEVLQNVQWYGPDTFYSLDFLPPKAPIEIGEFLLKVRMKTTYVTFPDNPVYHQFINSFEKKIGRKPIAVQQVFAGYDAAKLAVLSILNAGGGDLRKVIPHVAGTYFGITGHMWMDAAGDRMFQDYTIATIGKQEEQWRWVDIGYYDSRLDTIRPLQQK